MKTVDSKKSIKPAQTLSAAAMQYISARQANAKVGNGGGGHCQGGGSW